MTNKEQPNMQSITALTKFLIEAWRVSKCPDACEYIFECRNCKYNELCAKIEELGKVINK